MREPAERKARRLLRFVSTRRELFRLFWILPKLPLSNTYVLFNSDHWYAETRLSATSSKAACVRPNLVVNRVRAENYDIK